MADQQQDSAGVNKFISTLQEKTSTCVRFFYRNSDYYTVHGSDALFVAKQFYHTMAVIKYFSNNSNSKGDNRTNNPNKEKDAYVNVSIQMFESALKELLLLMQYRVEVYSKEGYNSWKLTKKGSPGNLLAFEDDLSRGSELNTSPIVLAITLAMVNGQKVIGAAFADTSCGKLSVCEFSDNDQYCNLEALHVQINAKECLVYVEPKNPDNVKMIKTLERSGMMITVRKKSEFGIKDMAQDLNRLLKIEGTASSLPEMDLKRSMGSLSAIIKYLELLSDETNFNQFDLCTFDLNQYMRLDAAAGRAMNLTPSALDGSNKTMCLTGLLNRCKTGQGQRLLERFVKQPLLNVEKIKERQNLVETLVEDSAIRQSLQEEHLKKYPDLYRLAKKFLKNQGTLMDCVRVKDVVERITSLLEALRFCEGEHKVLFRESFIDPLESLEVDFEKYIELIETTLEVDEDEHEVYIKPSYDDDLENIRNELDAVKEETDTELNRTIQDLGGLAVKKEQAPHLGYFFRITLKDESRIRKKAKYKTLETQKNGVRFTSSNLTELNERHLDLKAQYDKIQSTLAQEVIGIAAGYTEPMVTLNEIIAYIDVIVSFADVAVNAPTQYVRPEILPKGSGVISLKESRHPCLEVQDDVRFVPNDLHMKDDQSFLILTGPNMGGKSTYIRQVGVIVLMAQIGCFVPCTEATVSVVDCILARVGAGDSQLKGVSTLMAEMLETASILKSATKDSLIIVDELGRGTSTYDGFGLAWAISEHIVDKIGSFCLFATHFHELTILSDHKKAVKNFHVTALTTDKQLTLLYAVKEGFCDQSFGIHVAELADFPSEVVEMAKRKALELEDFSKNEEKEKVMKFDDQKEGEAIIEKFLKDLAEKKIGSLSEDEVMSVVKEMKTELSKQNNQYVNSLMSTA